MKQLRVLLATLLCLACATLPGQRTQTTLGVTGGYTRADYQATCSNQRQVSELAQGTVAIQHERESGLAMGVAGGMQRDSLVAVQNVTTARPGDTRWTVLGGGWVGWHGRWWAGDLGLSVSSTPLPYVAVRGGDLTRIWGEAQFGSYSPTSDPRLGAAGLGFRLDTFTFHPYIAVAAPLVYVFARNEMDIANAKTVVGLDINGHLSDRLGLGLRLMGGETLAGYLTLSFVLDADDAPVNLQGDAPLPDDPTGSLEP